MTEPGKLEAWVIWHPEEKYILGSLCYEKSSAITLLCVTYCFTSWKQAYRQGYRAIKVIITPVNK
jgi:hypothetical protein